MTKIINAPNEQRYARIALHGAPRSGTTWVGEIINSSPNTIYRYQPLFSYAHKDYLTPASTEKEIKEFYDRLLVCQDEFTNQTTKRKTGNLPQFTKAEITHIVYKEVRYHNLLFNLMRRTADIKLIALIRNPMSVINSWLNAPREFRADLGWQITEEWRYSLKKNMNKPEEFNGYEKWKELTNIFLTLQSLFPERVHIIKYSQLLKHPIVETKELFGYLGLDYTSQTDNFLTESGKNQNNDPYSVYRSNQTDEAWKSNLSDEIVKEIEMDIKNTPLSEFLRQ